MASASLASPTELEQAPYQPSELEAVARLLLRERHVKVIPGGWWSYYPERSEVVYPANLLSEWSADRSLGALCHEVAETLYSGPEASAIVASFVDRALLNGCEPSTARLLFNVVNDLRINRIYLREFPGSQRFFAAVYRHDGLVPQDDLPNRGPRPAPLPHHVFLDGLTSLWSKQTLRVGDGKLEGRIDDRVRRLLDHCWPSVRRAIETDDISAAAEAIQRDVVPYYVELVRASVEQLRRAALDPVDEGDSSPPPPTDELESDGELPDDLVSLIRGSPVDAGPAESWVFLPAESEPTEEEEDETRAKAPAPAAPNGEKRPPAPTPNSLWTGGVIQKFRRLGRRSHVTTIYEDFNYVEAVRRLQPQIDVILQGGPGRDGLIAILNRRRFGTLDPFRRPRRRRRGDSGDIDADHPENLRLAPAVAFLKGQRQTRDDSQKDFAHAILLDVSGSVVQSGYRSRKFDQLIDTCVVFCEIHQRLKVPFELIVFSHEFSVARRFDESRYDNLAIAPSSAYVVRDLTYIVLEMYRAEHGETHETPALDRAIADLSLERGLKTIFVVTDGISSDRGQLTDRLVEIEHRNAYLPQRERLMVLAFGLGLAENEFNLSYQPDVDGQSIQCSSGRLVPNLEALPTIVCDAVDHRIRTA
uniref:Two component transcriptional regulator n=1 Tax=uncultured bacterium F25-01 TaxID=1191433 RepID=I3VIH1_9BACT|nr:two component transcriptional regulator [uncultured bacterium F25-01]